MELREKVLSIPLHCANHHKFPSNEKHRTCSHSDLVGEERNKPWLKEGSKVRLVVKDNSSIGQNSKVLCIFYAYFVMHYILCMTVYALFSICYI